MTSNLKNKNLKEIVDETDSLIRQKCLLRSTDDFWKIPEMISTEKLNKTLWNKKLEIIKNFKRDFLLKSVKGRISSWREKHEDSSLKRNNWDFGNNNESTKHKKRKRNIFNNSEF